MPPRENKPLPPEDVIREDSGPSTTESPKHPKNKGVKIDVDDALIQEPRDDVFETDTPKCAEEDDENETANVSE